MIPILSFSKSPSFSLKWQQEFGVHIVNIAAYKFVAIEEPGDWVSVLKARCLDLLLKGTIVLATEGINLCLAGERQQISEFVSYLRNDPMFGGRFEDVQFKESLSDRQPFQKMVVRVAREIITMRQENISPADGPAPFVDAFTLKRWLDQGHDDDGREVVLLDTRDRFESLIGTFQNARTMEIQTFSQFPLAIRELIDEQRDLSEKTVVSFCTGGIRCEKAALYLQQLELPRVYQLDGGILRYFEVVGGAHWQGECFVFDERIAVDSDLNPTAKSYCRIGARVNRQEPGPTG